MKINVKKIIKDEERLTMYAKIPMFKTFREYGMLLNNYFKDNDNFLDIGIDETGKYVILDFVLRNKKDIEPYIKYGINKDLCKEIYERLNEIQYLLKFTYAKKKIRRKVKEVMSLLEKEVE